MNELCSRKWNFPRVNNGDWLLYIVNQIDDKALWLYTWYTNRLHPVQFERFKNVPHIYLFCLVFFVTSFSWSWTLKQVDVATNAHWHNEITYLPWVMIFDNFENINKFIYRISIIMECLLKKFILIKVKVCSRHVKCKD